MDFRQSPPPAEPAGAGAETQWTTRAPFSRRLQAFHRNLASLRWLDLAPTCVFVRDYEGLPRSAPFDIDLMAADRDLAACARLITDTARAQDLECVAKPASAGINILVLDLTRAPAYRTWAYYEIATHKRLTRNLVVTPEAMAIVRDAGLPVPSGEWRFLINLLQALRKGDLERYRAVLDQCRQETPGCVALTRATLGLSEAEVADVLAGRPSLAAWQERLGVAVKAAKMPPPPRRLRNRIRLRALRRFYVLPSKELYVVTVHGADGVGKTTACDKVSAIFAGYPIGLTNLHHVTSWKKPAPPAAPGAQTPVSAVRKVLRLGYRAAPEFVRDWWRATTGYHKNAVGLNERIYQGYLARQIILLDRYVYDTYLKQRIQRAIGPLGALIGLLHCLIMRRPFCAVLLTDRPADIIRRKQELGLDEIDAYQKRMERLLRRLRLRRVVIDVGGHDRDDVARELAQVIVRVVGTDLLQLMRYAVKTPRGPAAAP